MESVEGVMVWRWEYSLSQTPTPLHISLSSSGSLLAVGLPYVWKRSQVETSANGLSSLNCLYLFMQALASPQDSVVLTQEDSSALKIWPCITVTWYYSPVRRQTALSVFLWALHNENVPISSLCFIFFNMPFLSVCFSKCECFNNNLT